MATTTVELTADTWLDLGGAPSATLGNLTMQGGNTLGFANAPPSVSFKNITATAAGSGISAISGVPISLNGGQVDVSSGAVLTVAAKITGGGVVQKIGAGKLILNGANDYTGLTTVNGGTLQLGSLAQTPVLLGANGADIKKGKMLLDGAPAVLSLLKASYAGGAWNTGQF